MTVIVVDYGRGNLFSLAQALRHLDVAHQVTGDPDDLAQATRIIFPGVGAFGDAMAGLKERKLVEPLKSAAGRGVPILGICVGCQLLLTGGDEFGTHDGLDLIPGTVSRLPEASHDDPASCRIPNVGWRRLDISQCVSILDDPDGTRTGSWMYFVHSYAPMAEKEEHVFATIPVNGHDIPVAIQYRNVVGVQFHPEKSGPAGLQMLDRFLRADFSA